MRAAVLLFALPALVAAEPYLPAPFNARLAQPVITAAPQPRSLLARQDLGSIPECAISCLSSLGGSCTFGDIACYCTDPAAIASLQGCLPTVCQGDDLTNAVNAAQSLCADSGVTTFDSSSASEAVASATESAGDAIESASASAAEAVSSIQGAASAEASSAAGAVASARSSAASAVGSLTSAAGGAISSARSQIGASASSLSSALVASASASTTGGALPARATGMGYLVGAAAVAGGMMVGL